MAHVLFATRRKVGSDWQIQWQCECGHPVYECALSTWKRYKVADNLSRDVIELHEEHVSFAVFGGIWGKEPGSFKTRALTTIGLAAQFKE